MKLWLFLLYCVSFWWIYFTISWLTNHYHKHYHEVFSMERPTEKITAPKVSATSKKKYLSIKNKNITVIFPDLWLGKNISEDVIKMKDVKSAKTILYATDVYGMDHWGIGFDSEPFEIQGCRVQNCILTNKRDYHGPERTDKFDAILFPLIKMMSDEGVEKAMVPRRKGSQRFVAVFEDSPRVEGLIHEKISRDFINWTMTYRRDSDIPNPYGRIVPLNNPPISTLQQIGTNLKDLAEPSETVTTFRPKLVAWVVSNCEKAPSKRMEYVKVLQKYVDVDIFGGCGAKKCANASGTFPCDYEMAKTYKFYLSFENSICTDYVTEKLFNNFILSMVPIVMGGADYELHAPPNSYINVADFPSIMDLARYLLFLDGNQEEYEKYFEWRKSHAIIRRFPICALCEMLHDTNLPSKSYSNLHNWWYGENDDEFCITGDEMPYAMN